MTKNTPKLDKKGAKSSQKPSARALNKDRLLVHGRALVDVFLPTATEMSAIQGRTLISTMSTLVRPVLLAVLQEQNSLLSVPSLDKRERLWYIKAEFWTRPDSMYGDLIAESDCEEVRGFKGIIARLQEMVYDTHRYDLPDPSSNIPEFEEAYLARRLKALRPTLSRQEGHAVLRVKYAAPDIDHKFLCLVTIDHEEPSPSQAPQSEEHKAALSKVREMLEAAKAKRKTQH